MSGSHVARPNGGLSTDDNASVEVERSLAELCAAIERTAKLVRSELEALDDRPVILPEERWPTPIAPPAPRAHAATASVDTPLSAEAAAVAPARPRRRSGPRWIGLGALALLCIVALLLAVADRWPQAALATAPIAAQVSAPTPTSAASATVALPLLPPPTAIATQAAAPTATFAPTPIATATTPAVLPTTVPTVVPMSIPTAAPTATPQPTATMLPTPTAPPPTATLPPAATLASQVAASEAALRTGSFEVAIDYGQGNHSAVVVNFDLGGADRERRLTLATTSNGRTGQQHLELLAIGDRIWQRQPGQDWQPGVSQDGLWEQLQVYLPQISGASDLTVVKSGDMLILRWADRGRGADLELHIAASDGRFFRLQERFPATGVVMLVTYIGWNTPVSIAPPSR